jgi:branched-chain amino acid transport system permease protein
MIGSGVFFGAEEFLSSYTDQWRLIIGTMFILFVLFVPRGIVSIPSLVAQRLETANNADGSVDMDEPEVRSDD